MPLLGCFVDDHLVEMFPLLSQMRLQLCNIVNLAAVNALLQLAPDPVVCRVEIRNVGLPESWSDEVWCFTSFGTVFCALWAEALSFQQTSLLD